MAPLTWSELMSAECVFEPIKIYAHFYDNGAPKMAKFKYLEKNSIERI